MNKKGILLLMCLPFATASLGLSACGHEHTYDTTQWKSDATKHWHAATCEHTTEIKDVDGHTDANKDGVCEVCGYTPDHTHTYEAAWQSDASGHWHKADCFHDVTSAVETHTADDLGECTVCGYHVSDPDVSTISKALALAEKQKGEVVNGVIEKNDYSGTVVNYAFMDGYFYVSEANEYYGTETWYSKTANDEVFAVEKNSDGEVRRMTAFSDGVTEDDLNGYRFVSPITATIGDFNGVEALITGLYETGALNLNADFAESVEEGVYAFSYGYYEDGDFYAVSVSFSLSESYYIEEATVKVVLYSSWNEEVEVVAGEGENPDTYKAKEGVEGYTSMNYAIAQNVAEDTSNPYPAEEFLPASFKLVDANGTEVTNALTIKKGETSYLYLTEIEPETAIVEFSEVIAEGDAIDNWQVFVSATTDDSENYAISVRSYTIGEHAVKLTVNGVEYNLTLTVEAVLPSSITVNAYEEEQGTDWWGNDYTYYVPVGEVSTITVYTGKPAVVLGAMLDKGDDQTYTVKVNGVVATTEEIGWEDPDAWESGYVNAVTISTEEAGEYTVEFTSNAVATVKTTVTVVVKARPDMTEVLSGNYRYMADGINQWIVSFNDYSGTIMVGYQAYEYDEEAEATVLNMYTAEYAYAWDDEKEELTTSYVNGYNFGDIFSVNSDYQLCVDNIVVERMTADNAIYGVWAYEEFSWITYEYTLVSKMTFNEDGTGVFEDENATIYFTYEVAYDEENSVYNVTFAADANKTSEGTSTYFVLGTVTAQLSEGYNWMLTIDNGEVDEYDYPITQMYNPITGEEAYEWAVELEVGVATNVYTGSYSGDPIGVEKELFFNATEAGTYTVYATPYGDTTVLASYDEYYFVVNGVKVAGMLEFVVEEAERIDLTVVYVKDWFDYDFYVDFEAASVEDGEGGDEGGAVTTGAAFTVSKDIQSSTLEGEYTYTYDETTGAITVYDNGTVSDAFTITYIEGVLTYNGATLTKTEATEGLAGTWSRSFETMGLAYEVTFAEPVADGGNGEGSEGGSEEGVAAGTFVVVDENGFTLDGTYGYEIGENNAVTVTKDGEANSDFNFSLSLGNTWYVQTSAMRMPMALVDASGAEVTELAGTLYIMMDTTVLYTFTFPTAA